MEKAAPAITGVLRKKEGDNETKLKYLALIVIYRKCSFKKDPRNRAD